jgi:phosphoribosylpyrophosphate synthetase
MPRASVLKVDHLPTGAPECWVLDNYRALPGETAADRDNRTPCGRLVNETKYKSNPTAARELKLAIQESAECLPRWSVVRNAGLIVSLPTSEQNASILQVIEAGLSTALDIEVLEDAISWVNPMSRPIMKNIPCSRRPQTIAHQLEANPISGATVLLIDDLVQTGSSIGESVRALKDAGASQVVCFVATLVGGGSQN